MVIWTESNLTVDGTYTLMKAVKVCENRIPALVGKIALKTKSPLLVELLRMIVESEDPRPFAVRVPLIRMEDWDHGRT